MIRHVINSCRDFRRYVQLPRAAREERQLDRQGLPQEDPGIELAIELGISWLGHAQDHSLSHDGGVARHYSLESGWHSSYPETTGYIVPTMLAHAEYCGDDAVRLRAKRMLDWLVSIQFPCGGFRHGSMGPTSVVPVAFNTGQILLGLAAGVREFGEIYREPMRHAADWLVETQDSDGCWSKSSPNTDVPGAKTYYTHVAWGLFEAARLEPDKPYALSALSNVSWALKHQHNNGWFDKCCLTDTNRPLTHTIGYALRGIVEGYRFTKDPDLLKACRRTADGLLKALSKDGFLPGRLYSDWQSAVSWACLTGSVQIAHCWLMLYQDTGEVRYREAAYSVNQYVRRTMKVEGPAETRGAIKGSFPIQGWYGKYEYLNWSTKFFVDLNMLEKAVRKAET